MATFRRTAKRSALTSLLVLAATAGAAAQSVEQFYKDKSINLIVGFNPAALMIFTRD